MQSPYLKSVDWEAVRHKKINPDDIPYKPSPNKYGYVLNNEYAVTSSLQGEVNN